MQAPDLSVLNSPAGLDFINKEQAQLARQMFGKELGALSHEEMAVLSSPAVLAASAQRFSQTKQAGETKMTGLDILNGLMKEASDGKTTDAELEKLKNLGGHARGDRSFEAAAKKKKQAEKQAAYEAGALAVMKTAGFRSREEAIAAFNIYE